MATAPQLGEVRRTRQKMEKCSILEHAVEVEVKIEEQAEFVEWWGKTVLMLAEDAETPTGITQQQVSKWSKRLADRDAYRKRLYGVAWRAAMAVATASVVLADAFTRRGNSQPTLRPGQRVRQVASNSVAGPPLCEKLLAL